MAEEGTLEEAEGAGSSAAAPSGKNPLLSILVILNTLMLGGIAYVQFENHKKIAAQPSVSDIVRSQSESGVEGAPTEPGEAQLNDGVPFALDGFTANLAQGDGPRRFIRLNLVLQFDKSSNEDEYKSRQPQIRDSIIAILNAKRPEDLLKAEGKSFLKEEIKAAVNAMMVDGSVIDVYYVNFQIN